MEGYLPVCEGLDKAAYKDVGDVCSNRLDWVGGVFRRGGGAFEMRCGAEFSGVRVDPACDGAFGEAAGLAVETDSLADGAGRNDDT